MKHILFILLLSSSKLYACSCGDFPSLIESLESSDFVADITIMNTIYSSDENDNEAKIEINKLFKGSPIEFINFGGKRDGSSSSSCDVTLYTNKRYLVYLNMNNGKYEINACTRYSEYSELMTQDLKTLEHVMNSEHIHSNKISSDGSEKIKLDIDKSLIPLEPLVGYYELDLENKSVSTIAGFGIVIDSLLEQKLSIKKWNTTENSTENKRYILSILYFGNELELNSDEFNVFHYFE